MYTLIISEKKKRNIRYRSRWTDESKTARHQRDVTNGVSRSNFYLIDYYESIVGFVWFSTCVRSLPAVVGLGTMVTKKVDFARLPIIWQLSHTVSSYEFTLGWSWRHVDVSLTEQTSRSQNQSLSLQSSIGGLDRRVEQFYSELIEVRVGNCHKHIGCNFKVVS